jgi:hypothetical protein
MDPNFQEKLSHINDLIKLSMIDKKIKDGMIDITFSPPRSESKVIEQFHRVIILIGIDKLIYKEEVSFCVELGVRMGLNYGAINEVLKKTLRNPAHIMQIDEMKEIFNKYSN